MPRGPAEIAQQCQMESVAAPDIQNARIVRQPRTRFEQTPGFEPAANLIDESKMVRREVVCVIRRGVDAVEFGHIGPHAEIDKVTNGTLERQK
jgi:hypothetical protein